MTSAPQEIGVGDLDASGGDRDAHFPWDQPTQQRPSALTPQDPVQRALSFSKSHRILSPSASSPRPVSLLHTQSFSHVHRPKPQRTVSMAGEPSTALADSMETETTAWRAKAQGDTPLDRTIDAIGMGRYQWALLLLAGTGWATDNMFLQAIAIILPRVQRDFDISDRYIGLLSSSTFAGMMVGALAWGSYSDTYGRKGAFNGTLVLVALFGTLAAFATSFASLCVSAPVLKGFDLLSSTCASAHARPFLYPSSVAALPPWTRIGRVNAY